MTSHISLEQIDRSGALRELADEAGALDSNGTRREMLRRTGIAGAGFVAGGVLFNGMLSPAQAAGITFSTKKKSAANDAKIANYALTLEYLETEFYEKVDASGLFKGATASLIKEFGDQELTHVEALKGAVTKLGGTPAEKPMGKFPIENANQVAGLAYTVENLGASAYLGQAAKIQNAELLAAALAIHTVEARHAATLGTLVKKSITPDGAFAKPADMSTVLAAVKPFLA